MKTLFINTVFFVLLHHIVKGQESIFENEVERSKETSSTHLIMMSENLTSIPAAKGDIELLNVAYNQIHTLGDRIFLENNYKLVKKIYLYRNNLKNISGTAFSGLKQLKKLDISDNNLSTLDPYTFKGNSKLNELIVMNNLIVFDRLQTFIMSHSVETLVLSNNKITEIYGLTFLGVPNLKRLVLSYNELTNIAPISFKSLTKLQYLSLANTGVHRLSESMFTKPPRRIHLENTPLAERFEPPLQQITEKSITTLLKINEFVY